MPPLTGFSDNPFRTHSDILCATTALIKPLAVYKSPCGARIKLATATGTGFDEISAQLEGFARPLWAVADLLAFRAREQSTNKVNGKSSTLDKLDLESWIRGLHVGVNPESASFWGHLGNHDQRMVEMEPIAYALLAAPSQFLPTDEQNSMISGVEQSNHLKTWLLSVNDRVMPPSNWRWFRVLVNLALVKSCKVPLMSVQSVLEADFKVLDTFYLGKGWSSDGIWSEDKKQADYYSGSFAIQYSQLVYVRFAANIDEERVKKYRIQAREFSTTFWRYFDTNGAAIPFGRSLTYRFAFAAFLTAVVMADVKLPKPLNELGVVKGLLLRHLRWWAKEVHIFNSDGTLNIGFTYPNTFLSEDYNSPQSVYWSLKTLAVLGLPEDHEFWTCDELPHPLSRLDKPSWNESTATQNTPSGDLAGIEAVACNEPAMHITCGFPEHHFLLSSGQFTKKTHRAREAKYGKFAYSSAFAFSVPVGNSLEQMAPDSTLCVSNDNGDSWKVRWEPIDAQFRALEISMLSLPNSKQMKKPVPILVSNWRPWTAFKSEIETLLVPSMAEYPGWHVRIHKMSWPISEGLDVKSVDSGFAISSSSSNGGVLPHLSNDINGHLNISEGVSEDPSSSLVLSNAGASGVCNYIVEAPAFVECISRCCALKPDANTNLIAPRTLIPSVKHHFRAEIQLPKTPTLQQPEIREIWFATGVFAVSESSNLSLSQIRSMWEKKPLFNLRLRDGSVIDFTQHQTPEMWELRDR